MKKHAYVLSMFVSLLVPVYGFQLLQEGYTLSSYAQYDSQTRHRRIAFDDSGNLYVTHFEDGKIMKINAYGQSEVFASGLGNVSDITWTGGTDYGNYFYVTGATSAGEYDKLYRVDINGNIASAPMDVPYHQPASIDIDRTGNYNSLLYVGTSAMDRIATVSVTGTLATFANWPGEIGGGGIYGLAFDPTGNYDNKMYLANSFQAENAHVSGLFRMDTDGSVARFADALASALIVKFDPTGLYFDNDMFVLGRTSFSAANSIWRIYADGSSEQFMTNVNAFAFGDDGALYVSRYDTDTQTVLVSRVIPEPATLLLLAAGAALLPRRRR